MRAANKPSKAKTGPGFNKAFKERESPNFKLGKVDQ
jgi:hypothetical protein